MSLTYFKRFRMELDLTRPIPRDLAPPPGYSLLAWDYQLLAEHADAKYRSFRWEIDAHVFPCLGEREGCLRLMREIANKDNFVEEATWLLAYRGPDDPEFDFCGTIQGLADERGGSIQNLGITPEHRGRGLGRLLLCQSLMGFRAAGHKRVTLEVTGQNHTAIGLYQQLGFRRVRTVYKAAEVAYS